MKKFSEMHLKPFTLKALGDMGFQSPTPIQSEALPLVFQFEDLIGQAKTGTGKTAVFGIYLVDTLETKPVVQSLILVPTRELGMQVAAELHNTAKYSHLKVLPVYGGVSLNPQIEQLGRGVQIVVGTPGRVIDLIKRGALKLDSVKVLVLDEADRMLDMGFIDDVEFIINKTPQERQTLLFSATMPPEIAKLSKRYQKNPQFIKVSEDSITITHITHQFARVDFRRRFRALYGYLKAVSPQKALIFCNTKRVADSIVPDLRARGYAAESLHADLSQRQRDSAMIRFREGKTRILVASDLAARGLDISDISHVINFHLPKEPLTYTHRVGRTGRIGKGGLAFSIVADDELGLLGEIERTCGVKMEEITVAEETGFPAGRREQHPRDRHETYRRGGGAYSPHARREGHGREAHREWRPSRAGSSGGHEARSGEGTTQGFHRRREHESYFGGMRRHQQRRSHSEGSSY
jgi:ATP-dependent RNA helicase DeaD